MRNKRSFTLLLVFLLVFATFALVLAEEQSSPKDKVFGTDPRLYYWQGSGPEQRDLGQKGEDFPAESSLLARSSGLKTETNDRVVYSRDGMWHYHIRFSALDSEIELKKLFMKVYTYKNNYGTLKKFGPKEFQEWWQKTTLKPGESVYFGAGFPSQNDLYFADYYLLGELETGKKVLGTVRIHFSKDKWPDIDDVAGNQGIDVETSKKTVRPDDEGGYHYRVSFLSEKKVELKRLEIYYGLPQGGYGFDCAFGPKKLKEFLGSTKLIENKDLGMRTGFSPSDELKIKFRDYVAFGITESGKKVQGAVRVYFKK